MNLTFLGNLVVEDDAGSEELATGLSLGLPSRRWNCGSHRSITENRLQAIYGDYVLLRINLEAEVFALPVNY